MIEPRFSHAVYERMVEVLSAGKSYREVSTEYQRESGMANSPESWNTGATDWCALRRAIARSVSLLGRLTNTLRSPQNVGAH